MSKHQLVALPPNDDNLSTCGTDDIFGRRAITYRRQTLTAIENHQPARIQTQP
ncbi:MAG: hypothetical protein ACKO3I_03055 [Synechococcales cyanobacterium]|nr:hypothetical protein [Cyanobacteria bacterium REEB444]